MKSHSTALLVSIVALAGCSSSSGVSRAETAAASMAEFRSQVGEGKKQVDTVTASLNGMTTVQGDLKPAYEKFVGELDRTESLAASLKAQADEMKAKGREFFKKWEEEIEQIKDPALREKAKARAGERSKQYANIEMVMGSVKGTWTTFSGELKDIKQYLSNDLTPKGVSSLSDTLKKSNLDATELKKSLDNVLASMDAVAADFGANSGK